MTIYIYQNKKTQEVFADLFAKDLLEGVTTFPRIDNAQSYSFLELSCLYIKRILEMKDVRFKPFTLRENPNQRLLQHYCKHVIWGLMLSSN